MKIFTTNNTTILVSSSVSSAITEQWFCPDFWRQQQALVDAKQGRATAWFFSYQGLVAVLKHYYRGGLIGRLLSDQYLFTGIEKTRVYQEFALLESLKNKGLAVAEPIAAKIQVSKLIYRGDIITKAIEGATSVREILQNRELNEDELEKIAVTIAEFHHFGAYHDDLNINNILFDSYGKVYLIDFDKGELREPDMIWQNANMERLKRSFYKEAGKWPTFHFTDAQWQSLYEHYLQAR